MVTSRGVLDVWLPGIKLKLSSCGLIVCNNNTEVIRIKSPHSALRMRPRAHSVLLTASEVMYAMPPITSESTATRPPSEIRMRNTPFNKLPKLPGFPGGQVGFVLCRMFGVFVVEGVFGITVHFSS